jgi:molybdopterin-guanine dinucleotide biosynthesis protein
LPPVTSHAPRLASILVTEWIFALLSEKGKKEYSVLMTRTIIGVGGFSSNTGKTTLMCELLRAFPGWEAVKITRGHYRSCGKDPRACCVSHLLSAEPVILSGRAETYTAGKDTGRYWDAGASNVHWAIVTDKQVEQGIKLALERVQAPGVFVEGTSFRQYIEVDFMLMAAAATRLKQLKPSASRALALTDALYLSDELGDPAAARESLRAWQKTSVTGILTRSLPVYTRDELPQLTATLRALHEQIAV